MFINGKLTRKNYSRLKYYGVIVKQDHDGPLREIEINTCKHDNDYSKIHNGYNNLQYNYC